MRLQENPPVHGPRMDERMKTPIKMPAPNRRAFLLTALAALALGGAMFGHHGRAHAEGTQIPVEQLMAPEALRLLIEGESLPRRPLQADTVGEMIDWIVSVSAYTLRYDNLDDATACVRDLFEL